MGNIPLILVALIASPSSGAVPAPRLVYNPSTTPAFDQLSVDLHENLCSKNDIPSIESIDLLSMIGMLILIFGIMALKKCKGCKLHTSIALQFVNGSTTKIVVICKLPFCPSKLKVKVKDTTFSTRSVFVALVDFSGCLHCECQFYLYPFEF